MTNILQPLIDRFVSHSDSSTVDTDRPMLPTAPKRVHKVLTNWRSTDQPDTPDGLVRHLKSAGRYAVLLKPQVSRNLKPGQLIKVVELLGNEMSRIPSGPVGVEFPYLCEKPNSTTQLSMVDSFLLDRFAVTNAEFKQFVDEGCYDSKLLWDPNVLPAIDMFVDQTGHPGPSGWKDGAFPKSEKTHPVVGICWHEANAYARWVGKRLPTRAEWVKAASWPLVADGKPTRQRAFPWGENSGGTNANIWSAGLHHTVPVDEFQNGNSASDVCQLCGNVWEWIANDFEIFCGDVLVTAEDSVKALRGGAFDTYFERQASCQFESGDNCFSRKPNIGFRCAASVSDFASEAQELLESLDSTPSVLVAEMETTDDSTKEPDEATEGVGQRLLESIGTLRKWASETHDRVRSSKSSTEQESKTKTKDDDKPYKSPFAGPGF